MYVQRNIDGTFVQTLLEWKSNKYYTMCVCVCVFVALVTQHAVHMRHIVICGLSRSATFFYLISSTIFGGKKLLNIKCVLRVSIQRLSETFFILRRTKQDMIKNAYLPSRKLLVFFLYFNGT